MPSRSLARRSLSERASQAARRGLVLLPQNTARYVLFVLMASPYRYRLCLMDQLGGELAPGNASRDPLPPVTTTKQTIGNRQECGSMSRMTGVGSELRVKAQSSRLTLSVRSDLNASYGAELVLRLVWPPRRLLRMIGRPDGFGRRHAVLGEGIRVRRRRNRRTPFVARSVLRRAGKRRVVML